jgi:hypothetical protein
MTRRNIADQELDKASVDTYIQSLLRGDAGHSDVSPVTSKLTVVLFESQICYWLTEKV